MVKVVVEEKIEIQYKDEKNNLHSEYLYDVEQVLKRTAELKYKGYDVKRSIITTTTTCEVKKDVRAF